MNSYLAEIQKYSREITDSLPTDRVRSLIGDVRENKIGRASWRGRV